MNKNINSIALMLLLGLFAASCTGIYENGEELAGSLKGRVDEVTADELRTRIDNGDDFLLLDVRQQSEYDNGSIPGAVNIPRGELEFKIRDDGFWEEEYLYTPENDAEIIIFCKLGYRGALSAHALKQLGFTKVKNLKGGMLSWDPEMDKNAPVKSSGGGCGG
ncbi:MAG: rhodanese-like domain-containing protein [Bacteroidales bacterium]